jgi:antitoxin component YwqK of YwqJK toxin-antitoxin module
MSKINQYNENGQPHGLWEYYYSNGKLCYKGTYVNGQHHGLWEHYYSNGQLCYKGTCVNGKRYGLWKYYNEDGTIKKQIFLSKYFNEL